MIKPILSAQNVNIGYGIGANRSEIIKDLNLEVAAGEFVAILGFSGSGKTTLMKLLCGLLTPDSGELKMDGQPFKDTSKDRGLVFQNYSLLPWLTVYGNIHLAVKQTFPEWSKAQKQDHVMKMIDMVSLSHAVWRRPHELSGGMRQRVSLARTLSMQPRILLLDEPLSALDALTRSVLQDEILDIWETQKTTCILITNDVDEALVVADRIIALTPGPEATLGLQFKVDLARPRNRAELNHNEQFKAMRNEITSYLIGLRNKARAAEEGRRQTEPVVLPPLTPRDFSRAKTFVSMPG